LREKYSIETAKTFRDASEQLSRARFGRVVTDLLFPTTQGKKLKANGIKIAKICRKKGILCTLYSTVKNDPFRSLLLRTHLKRAKSQGIEVKAKRETMRTIKRKKPR